MLGGDAWRLSPRLWLGIAKLGEESPMRAFTCVAIAMIAAAISIPSIGDAFAQAGSAGGRIGKTDKSISGGEETRRPAKRASQPPRRREPATTSASFDGSWAGMSVGPCIGHFAWKVQVTNGVISGGATGQIGRNGATKGDMAVMGKHFLFRGVTRASGQASGTWTSSRNCSGSWTAVRS